MSTCRCGDPHVTHSTFNVCGHCDQPCDSRGCDRCANLKSVA